MTLTKLDAAKYLVDAALEALLDRGDPISAIVLGGSAEDVFQGLLLRKETPPESARQEMIPHIRAFLEIENPDSSKLTDKQGADLIRQSFNWLRHNDRTDDLQEMTCDFGLEAAAIIERALVNANRFNGLQHPRYQELLMHGRRVATLSRVP